MKHTEKRKQHGLIGGHQGMMPGEKAKNFKGTIAKLLKYLGRFRVSIAISLLLAAMSTIFFVIGPKIAGNATTKLAKGIIAQLTGTGGIDFVAIGQIMLFLLGLYLLSSVLGGLQGWLMSGIATKVSYSMRKEISQKINRLPLSYFDCVQSGDVLSRITNDVDTVTQTLNQSLSQMVTNCTQVIGILIMMLSISLPITLLALLMLPMSAIIVGVVVKQSQPLFQKQQKYLGNANGHVEEMYGAHLVVKAFNGEKNSIDEFEKINQSLYESAWKSQFLSGLMMPLMNFVGNLGYVGICILGGFLALKGSIEVGDIQAFIQYVRQFTQPITQIANISNVLQQTAAAAERVFEFLEEPEESPEPKQPVSPENLEGSVSFKNVKFGYVPEKTIINDFSIDIKPGQKVAIVGPTGAGKTTIVKLLMRFYDVTDGAVFIDGHNIKDFTRNGLRSMFGMVLQDTWLYNASIMENIRYGKLSASESEVIEAAKAAQVHHFVKTLPDGYNMMLNEEASNISQGQKQLLTIARTILSDPQILILDEATSSVDTRTEVLIQKAMDHLMEGRTSFIIAHRLSTIRDADVILVMKNGDIVETGNHHELLEKGGFYADLYNSQFEDVG